MAANLGVSCDPLLVATLNTYCDRTGVPKSAVVTRLLRAFFDQKSPELPSPDPADIRKPVRRRGMGKD